MVKISIIIFKKKVGKNKKIKHNDMELILQNIPNGWEYTCKCTHKSGFISEREYTIKFYKPVKLVFS